MFILFFPRISISIQFSIEIAFSLIAIQPHSFASNVGNFFCFFFTVKRIVAPTTLTLIKCYHLSSFHWMGHVRTPNVHFENYHRFNWFLRQKKQRRVFARDPIDKLFPHRGHTHHLPFAASFSLSLSLSQINFAFHIHFNAGRQSPNIFRCDVNYAHVCFLMDEFRDIINSNSNRKK